MDNTGWWGPYYPNQGVDEALDWYWSEKGDFTVRVKAKDGYGAESDWATLPVTVSKAKVKDTLFSDFLDNFLYLSSFFQSFLDLTHV